jgi:two-component system OmpR family response regulator
MARILLVEDDVDVRTIMEHVLIDAGHEVDATGTEGSARDLLRYLAYDLVIADARLPDGTGMAVADDARENDTKALIVTGYAFTLPHGTFDRYEVLLKPFRPAELLDAVARRLAQPDGQTRTARSC